MTTRTPVILPRRARAMRPQLPRAFVRLGRLAPLLCAALAGASALAPVMPARAESTRATSRARDASTAGGVDSAAETLRAMELNEAGSALYAAGDYAAALERFERAHALVAEPNLLFNIAGCHERLGQRRHAIEYYRWFLSSPGGAPRGRQRAIDALGRLEPAPPAAESLARGNDAAWPLATLGAGILLSGLGAALYVDGAHDHDRVTIFPDPSTAAGSNTPMPVGAQRQSDAGDTKRWFGAIGVGLGGALIATHVVLMAWHAGERESDAPSAQLEVVPGGWAVTGSF